jgi:hypothetical protein
VARFLSAFPLADTVAGVAAFVAPIIIHRDRIDRCRESMSRSRQKRGGNQKAAKRRYGLHRYDSIEITREARMAERALIRRCQIVASPKWALQSAMFGNNLDGNETF